MILVDANILLYAEDAASPLNAKARNWWDAKLSGDSPVFLCWEVIHAFIRIGTHPRVFQRPLRTVDAIERVSSWLAQPCVKVISPTENHWEIFKRMLSKGQASANLVPDAHLAALAVEHGCDFYSSDSDFSRFPKIKWKNPIF